MSFDPFAEAAAELGFDADELAGTFDRRTVRAVRHARCRCGGPIENKYGTCDECQDAAYQGDANGRY